MPFELNPYVCAVVEPPIAEAKTWVEDYESGADRPLLDLAQAVPSYPPAKALRAHLAERNALFETAQYTDIRGTLGLREALISAIRRGRAIALEINFQGRKR